MSLNIETLPPTYRSSVNWYVSDWQTSTLTVFDNKNQAVEYAKSIYSGDTLETINVDWCPLNQSCRDISRRAKVVDKRSVPHY